MYCRSVVRERLTEAASMVVRGMKKEESKKCEPFDDEGTSRVAIKHPPMNVILSYANGVTSENSAKLTIFK